MSMINLSLSDQEVNVLKMSINHCLETCKDGGSHQGCTDCQTLAQVADKIAKTKPTT